MTELVTRADARAKPLAFAPAVSILAAAGVAFLVRLFRYRISYTSALIALFAGDLAGIFIYTTFVARTARSPYPLMPYRSVFGLLGLMVSLLLSAWLVQLIAKRRYNGGRR